MTDIDELRKAVEAFDRSRTGDEVKAALTLLLDAYGELPEGMSVRDALYDAIWLVHGIDVNPD